MLENFTKKSNRVSVSVSLEAKLLIVNVMFFLYHLSGNPGPELRMISLDVTKCILILKKNEKSAVVSID